MLINVGVSDMKISTNKDDEIITHALGSCIGFTIYDRKKCIGGLLHFLLPKSRKDEKSLNPYMYADTGIPHFFKIYKEKGGDLKNAVFKACGGATINIEKDNFNIGKKNILALKKVLWYYNIMLSGGDFGKDYYRTMKISLNTGKVTCKNHLYGEWEI